MHGGRGRPPILPRSAAARRCRAFLYFGLVYLVLSVDVTAGPARPDQERMAEWTVDSRKIYPDPFNDVDVDVVFERNGERWRVPMFWRGENRWTVRFAPPQPGTYRFHLESTDRTNSDLNGHANHVTITGYRGQDSLLHHGPLGLSPNKRYFQQADGTPFFWLGDTWWAGLSTRLSWEDFQALADDRQTKGFTVVQVCAGLAPSYEETAPVDPGFCNEGGCSWTPKFERINPQYFDYADRRIQYLLDKGLMPAIVGAWNNALPQMGLAKMKRHWRYIIARYGAFPVVWIAGGEIYDPAQLPTDPFLAKWAHEFATPGWTDVVQYIRMTDPYRRLLTVHEIPPPFDSPVTDESLTDFDLFQPGHEDWPSLATAIAQLDKHYARTTVTKPLVVGELGYEGWGGAHLEDFQRAAFWLSMLNGAAGYTYGAIATWESYGTDMPFQRLKFSFLTWKEGMDLPGSYQIGIGSKLLRQYPWWEFQPHPEWVEPRGTTLLKPNKQISDFDIDLLGQSMRENPPPEADLPFGEWKNKGGTFRLPYAAGIPGVVRFIYMPYSRGFLPPAPPVSVLGLEPDVHYHAYYWEPALGIHVDLGVVERGVGSTSGRIDTSRLVRELRDARGEYRGALRGPGWDDYATDQHVDGGTYKPVGPPTIGDWVLVLGAQN